MMNGGENGSGRLPGGRAGIGHSRHLLAQLAWHIALLLGHIIVRLVRQTTALLFGYIIAPLVGHIID